MACAATACAGGTRAGLTVVASGLDNPRQLSVGPRGALYVSEAGSGGDIGCARDPSTGGRICIGRSGAIATLAGRGLRSVVAGLPSVSAPGGAESSGPADAVVSGGQLAFVVQDTHIDAHGANQFGAAGRLLGKLVEAPLAGGRLRVVADLARFEAIHNPDRGAAAPRAEAVDSDPYALAPYRGGYAIVDAAGNDLLWVDHAGRLQELAVFSTQDERSGGKPVAAQSVPTSLAVGPDGALYVGELTGSPFQPGRARVWRVTPGRVPAVYADGFTGISAITFDHRGRLLVLEISRAGGLDLGAGGELIRVDERGHREVLASAGLVAPTGVAVADDGSVYVSNHGDDPGRGSGPSGELVHVPAR